MENRVRNGMLWGLIMVPLDLLGRLMDSGEHFFLEYLSACAVYTVIGYFVSKTQVSADMTPIGNGAITGIIFLLPTAIFAGPAHGLLVLGQGAACGAIVGWGLSWQEESRGAGA